MNMSMKFKEDKMRFKILGKTLLEGDQGVFYIDAASEDGAKELFKIYYPDGVIDNIELTE